MTRVSLDHVVVLAPRLSRAEASFRGMGFQVTGGGTHVGGATGNRLVGLADGSYLELLTFFPTGDGAASGAEPADGPWQPGEPSAVPPAGLSPMAARFWHRARSLGPIFDLALRVDDLEGVIRGLRARDIAVDDAVEGRRTRDDGVELAWTMAFPRVGAFPFLIQDLTPREHRVPQGSATEHPNRVTGVAEVRIPISPDEAAQLAGWSSAMGLPLNLPSDHPGCWDVRVGDVRLAFQSAESGNRGLGPRYGVWLSQGDGRNPFNLLPTSTGDGSGSTPQGQSVSTASLDWELRAESSAG